MFFLNSFRPRDLIISFLQRAKEMAYDIHNPDFKRAMAHHVRETAEQVITELRNRGGLSEEYKDTTFAALFPQAARRIAEQSLTTEESADDEEDVVIEDGDQLSGSQYVEGQDTSSGAASSSGSKVPGEGSEESSGDTDSTSLDERSPKKSKKE